MSESTSSTLPVAPIRRRKGMEIHIPLFERADRAGQPFFIAAEVCIDQQVNLADYVVLILMGNEKSGPQIVMRPRDDDSFDE